MQKKELFKIVFEVEKIFKSKLSQTLCLQQVKGPIYLETMSGLNDDLSGVEKALGFKHKAKKYEVVQSLAKWKRKALAEYGFSIYQGLFVEMHALRPKESTLTKYHDFHVDQYDWEKVITVKDRNLTFLQQEVQKIYAMIYEIKEILKQKYPFLKYSLAKNIIFITASELYDLYPNLEPKAREKKITKKYKSVFIVGIGHKLPDGLVHGKRAADYDDWTLNGDILVWDEINHDVLELSSMGIRVDAAAIIKQHQILNFNHKLKTPFHQAIINQKLPLTIGGGIGISRTNMFLLEQKNILKVK